MAYGVCWEKQAAAEVRQLFVQLTVQATNVRTDSDYRYWHWYRKV